MVPIRELLYADDAILTSHTEDPPAPDGPVRTCQQGVWADDQHQNINVMGQDIPAPPSISIDREEIVVTHHFTCLCSTVVSNLSLNAEITKCITKATDVMAKLSRRV